MLGRRGRGGGTRSSGPGRVSSSDTGVRRVIRGVTRELLLRVAAGEEP